MASSPSKMLRKSQRNPKKVTVFTFPADHKPAAVRIKECRERNRVFFAVRKTRGKLGGAEYGAEEAEKEVEEDQNNQGLEDVPAELAEPVDQGPQQLEQEKEGAQKHLGFSKPKTRKKPALIVKFMWKKK